MPTTPTKSGFAAKPDFWLIRVPFMKTEAHLCRKSRASYKTLPDTSNSKRRTCGQIRRFFSQSRVTLADAHPLHIHEAGQHISPRAFQKSRSSSSRSPGTGLTNNLRRHSRQVKGLSWSTRCLAAQCERACCLIEPLNMTHAGLMRSPAFRLAEIDRVYLRWYSSSSHYHTVWSQHARKHRDGHNA